MAAMSAVTISIIAIGNLVLIVIMVAAGVPNAVASKLEGLVLVVRVVVPVLPSETEILVGYDTIHSMIFI